MYKAQAQTFQRDFEYENEKRQQRKADKQRRQARKGKRVMWSEAE